MVCFGANGENVGVDPDQCCGEIAESIGKRVKIRRETPWIAMGGGTLPIGVLDLCHGERVPARCSLILLETTSVSRNVVISQNAEPPEMAKMVQTEDVFKRRSPSWIIGRVQTAGIKMVPDTHDELDWL